MAAPMSRASGMTDDDALCSIHDLIAEFDVTARTIRYYEAEGMLHPVRRGQHRLFAPRERIRLRLILRGRRLGFSLAEVRDIIDLYDAESGEAGQLDYFLGKIAERRQELLRKQRDIEASLDDLTEAEQRCRTRLDEMKADR